MTHDATTNTLERYLRAEIDVEEAANALMAAGGGHPGFSLYLTGMDEGQRERVDALMARLMWLVLRTQDPSSAPERPFDAAGWRAMREAMERLGDDSGSEEST